MCPKSPLPECADHTNTHEPVIHPSPHWSEYGGCPVWILKALRIPVKWGTDSGEVGQCRSEATLGISMIGEVPHMSQESSGTVVQSASFRFFFRGTPEGCIPVKRG